MLVGALAAHEYGADLSLAVALHLTETGDPAAARDWVDRAEWFGGSDGHRWLRGDALLALGDSAAALAAYDSALDGTEDPDGWGGAWTQRADLALSLGADTTGMAADLDRGLRTCHTAYTRSTRALYRSRAGELERALEEIDHAIALDSALANSHYVRAQILSALDREGAGPAYERAVHYAPGAADIHRERLLYHGRRGEWSAMDGSARALVRLLPDDLTSHLDATLAAYCLRDADRARHHLSEAVRLGYDLDESATLRAFYDGEHAVGAECAEEG